ncbi:MAG: hypothetical protein ACJAYS_000181 [Lentimonas sp.]|jgi:hypothetical protein
MNSFFENRRPFCYRPRRAIYTLITLGYLYLFFPVFLIAGKVDWDGGGDNTTWSDSANWKKNKLPKAKDDAKFKDGLNASTDLLVDLEGEIITVKKIEVDTAGTVTFNNGQFDISKEIKIKGGGTLVLNVSQFFGGGDIKVEEANSTLAIGNSDAVGSSDLIIKKGGSIESPSNTPLILNNTLILDDGDAIIGGENDIIFNGSIVDDNKNASLIINNTGTTSINGDITNNSGKTVTVFVDDGATLAGEGTINVQTMFSTNSILDLSSTNTLSFTDTVSFDIGSIIQIELGATQPNLDLYGLGLGTTDLSNVTLSLIEGDNYNPLIDYTVFNGIGPNPFNDIILNGFNPGVFIGTNSNGDLIVATPEPSTYALIIGVTALLTVVKKKRQILKS